MRRSAGGGMQRQDKFEPDADKKLTPGKAFVSWTNAGVLGFHMISGPLLGIFLGYHLDKWLDSKPVCVFIGIFLGLIAGGLNMYRDMRRILRDQAAEDAREKLLRMGNHSSPEGGRGALGASSAKPLDPKTLDDDEDE